MEAFDEPPHLKPGDIVRVAGKDSNPTGVVVEIGDYGKVFVFWPSTSKVSHSGKKWSEMNLELINEYH